MAKTKILKSNLGVTLVLIIVGVLFLYSFASTGQFTGTKLDCSDPGTFLSGLDTDKDQLPDDCEKIYGSNKVIDDTDGDGCLDGEEIGKTDPLTLDCAN